MIPGNVHVGAAFADLVRTQIELWNTVDARLRAEHDVALGSFQTLTVVAETPNCRVFDIASTLAITVGGASKIVDRLETRGHCERRANPDDRRSSIIRLSPSGHALLDSATLTFDDELQRLLGPSVLSSSELHALANTLAAVRNHLSSTKGTTRS